SKSSAKQHSQREYRLRKSPAFLRESAGNHRLRCGRISGFADSNERARDQQKHETPRKAPGESCRAPEQNTRSNNCFSAKTVRKKSERNAGKRKHNEQPRLQRAQL